MQNALVLLGSLLLVSGSQAIPKITNVHITLGDYFVDPQSPIQYRVGFTLMAPPENIHLVVNTCNCGTPQVFTVAKCNHYKKVDSNPENPINYERHFCFVELSGLLNPKNFKYQFFYGEVAAREPFHFTSEIIDSPNPNIVVFGDHDVLTVGLKTKEALENYPFDLLVFVGDLAYDVETDNGARGDDYFSKMEPIFTKAPYIISPGNHENYDEGRFLASRFWMPGTKQIEDNHLFYFQVHDILFVTLNQDIPINIRPNDYWDYVFRLDRMIQDASERLKPKYKVYFSHRPFYCSNYLIEETRCAQLPYIMKPFEDVLNKNNIKLFFWGHLHFYERFAHMDSLAISEDPSKAMVITGAGGNHEIFEDMTPYDIQFKRKHVYKTVGFNVMRPKGGLILLDWVAAEGMQVMDSVVLPYSSTAQIEGLKKWLGVSAIFLLVAGFVAAMALWKMRKDQQEREFHFSPLVTTH